MVFLSNMAPSDKIPNTTLLVVFRSRKPTTFSVPRYDHAIFIEDRCERETDI